MRLKNLLHLGVGVQLTFFASALYSQSLLNVDFRGNSDHVKTGLAATGRTTSDYWNVCSFPSQRTGTISELKQSDETVTPVTLTLENGGGYWFNSTGDAMYDGYTYQINGADDGTRVTSRTRTTLAAGQYDIYV